MTYAEIFLASLPQLPLCAEAFDALARLEGMHVIPHTEEGNLVAFAAVEGEALRLLCVHPDWQRRGIGGELLRAAEEKIRGAGGREIVVGGSHSKLLIGAPEASRRFFERRGFELMGECDEMTGDLRRLTPAASLPSPAGVAFGWYRGELAALQEAVRAVDEDWVQYFPSTEHVFCGMQGEKIVSFCFADESEVCLLSNGKNRVGVPGCVGTVPAFRRQGIGLKMVALACEELKKQGCDTGFIHYTGMAHWYARLGFETVVHELFFRKSLA